MPKKAMRLNQKVWEEVSAADCEIGDVGRTFKCCTERCRAEMVLVSAAESRAAYFRSKDKRQHISVQCVKNSIVFEPSDYDENMFDLEFAFQSMMGNASRTNRGDTGTRQGNVGGGRHLRIHTLPILYAMCISKTKNEMYNGILIDDIFADENNYERYQQGIEDYKIVETTFYHKIKDELAFRLNYPANNIDKNSWVKVSFDNEELFWKQYNKTKNSLHIEPIIVAGEWKIVEGNQQYHSECVIYNERQIYYANMQ